MASQSSYLASFYQNNVSQSQKSERGSERVRGSRSVEPPRLAPPDRPETALRTVVRDVQSLHDKIDAQSVCVSRISSQLEKLETAVDALRNALGAFFVREQHRNRRDDLRFERLEMAFSKSQSQPLQLDEFIACTAPTTYDLFDESDGE